MKKLKIFLDPKPWLLLVADGKSIGKLDTLGVPPSSHIVIAQ